MTAPVKLVLVARDAVMKSHFTGQTTLGQQFQCAIDGGETNFRVLLADQAEQLVGGKMVACLQKGAQNRVALLRMLKANALEVPEKKVLGLAHGFAGGRCVIVNASLQHPWGRK